MLTTGRLSVASRVTQPQHYDSWVQKQRTLAMSTGGKPGFGSFYNLTDAAHLGQYNVTQAAGKDAPRVSMGKRLGKNAQFIEQAERAARATPAPGQYESVPARVTNKSKGHAPSFGRSGRRLGMNDFKAHQAKRGQSSFQMAARSTFTSTSGIGVTSSAMKKAPSFGFGGRSRRF